MVRSTATTRKDATSSLPCPFCSCEACLGRKSRVSVGRRGSAAVTSHWQQLACCCWFPEWPPKHVTGESEPRQRVNVPSERRSHASRSRAATQHMAHALRTSRAVSSSRWRPPLRLHFRSVRRTRRCGRETPVLWRVVVRKKFLMGAVLHLTRERKAFLTLFTGRLEVSVSVNHTSWAMKMFIWGFSV